LIRSASAAHSEQSPLHAKPRRLDVLTLSTHCFTRLAVNRRASTPGALRSPARSSPPTASRIPIHNVKEQRTEVGGQRTQERPAGLDDPAYLVFPSDASAPAASAEDRSTDDRRTFRPPISVRRPLAPGGADRDRTGDPLLAKQVLSQLSYGPGRRGQRSENRGQMKGGAFGAAGTVLCPLISVLRLWWAREDLNFRPHAYQARALTS
jgi:hypothetical protein